ncbi:hypothetical protein KXX11_004445, partial [Aspergillus fumigatus]
QAHLAGARAEQAGHHAQQGGLAGAVGPPQAGDAAGGQRRTDAVDRRRRAGREALLERLQHDGGVAHGSRPRAVDQGGAQVGGLDRLGGELGGGRHKADHPVVGLAGAAVGAQAHPGAAGELAQLGFGHIGAHPHRF